MKLDGPTGPMVRSASSSKSLRVRIDRGYWSLTGLPPQPESSFTRKSELGPSRGNYARIPQDTPKGTR